MKASESAEEDAVADGINVPVVVVEVAVADGPSEVVVLPAIALFTVKSAGIYLFPIC